PARAVDRAGLELGLVQDRDVVIGDASRDLARSGAVVVHDVDELLEPRRVDAGPERRVVEERGRRFRGHARKLTPTMRAELPSAAHARETFGRVPRLRD